MNLRFVRYMPAILLSALFASGMGLYAQAWPYDEDLPRGDALVAERFVIWAEEAIAGGQLAQAQAALERASDFADVSSDVSYLLAYVRSRNGESRFLVLQALELAIGTNRWRRYNEAQARLLQARQLIALRRFYAALESLDIYRTFGRETIDTAMLRLEALKGLALADLDLPPATMPIGPPSDMPGVRLPFALEFRTRLLETMDHNPRDPRPLRMLFGYASRRVPNEDDLALVEIALIRLPFLLDEDPELAWMAVPFIGNLEEARRLILAYRAGSFGIAGPVGFSPNPASIVPALNLGLMDDFVAVDEFFAPPPRGEPVLDKDLITAVGGLLRSDEGRDRFAERLHSFTGTITRDEDRDGIPESRMVFRAGVLQAFYHDADQDGLTDWTITFDTGLPRRGEMIALPEPCTDDADAIVRAVIIWSRYPSVQQVIVRGETFIFAPGSFQYSPIGFVTIGSSETYEGLMLPIRNHLSPGLTRRALAASAVILERQCLEFQDGTERIYLRQGMPVLSEVTAGGMLISVTEFQNGFPVIQRLDLDRDGRMETIRRFRPGTNILESSASDWNGDGVFEYTELHPGNGPVIRN
ncbi:MAG: hypothetical protein FWD88_02170 [Treponema sp.]|nr:hypothetical protein [Treponema sp.]